MSQFGELVRKLRRERDLTLEEVAGKIGSHKGYVSGIENGKVNPPSVKFIRKFAKLFKYDEREMVRIAYVDKAPKAIREEVRALMFSRKPGVSVGSSMVEIPLLNTMETGYSTKLTSGGRLVPIVENSIVVPRTGDGPSCAATVCDNSMEQTEGFSLRRGDIVLLTPHDKIENGGVVYLLFSDRDRKVAMIRQVMLEQNGNVILQPFNKDYPLEFLTRDDIEVVYVVSGRIEMFERAPQPVGV